MIIVFVECLLLSFSCLSLSTWLTKEAAQYAVNEFRQLEESRNKIVFRGTDRRSSAPFISGDGFRSLSDHICEDANRCRMDPAAVKNGDIIFVKTDFFDYFVKDVINRFRNNTKYIIVSHNGDLSAPDGQDDAPRIGMPRYITSDILREEFKKGNLLAHHGQNLWWKNNTFSSRPEFTHCLPIGFENRQYPVGKRVSVYVDALEKNILNKTILSIQEQSIKPLLLVAFYPKSRVPDRHKVLSILSVFPPKGQPKNTNPFFNYTDLNHAEWLDAIVHHRFVLAPFGHGLDTHRISEILLMGGIPVMKKSTISSCYDDSDNSYLNRTVFNNNVITTNVTRGSLPVVILNKWEDLTKEKLEEEWIRISKIPIEKWDYSRLFINHWIDRIKYMHQ
eukprot:gene4506-6366_t